MNLLWECGVGKSAQPVSLKGTAFVGSNPSTPTKIFKRKINTIVTHSGGITMADINENPVSVPILFTSDKSAHFVYTWFPQNEEVPSLPKSDYFRNVAMNVGDYVTVIGATEIVMCVCIAIGKDGPIVDEFRRVSIDS
jgi:hypothetical protein